uniref:Transmembrane 4 L6 family member 1-like n=1 Tax=Salarias fasciatus TaxID=181472 RepID=A0A672GGU5_SALFA
MCTGACSKFVAIPLYVLVLVSVVCNILLFFPDFDTKYAQDDGETTPRLTAEVKYMGGVIGGGIMALIPAIHIHLTGTKTCCANRCGMFLSIGFAAAGVAGGVYSLAVAALGLANGPTCLGVSGSYLTDQSQWALCFEPKDVVQFNLALFSTLLVAAGLQIILCSIQMVNGLFGCICGTCSGKEGTFITIIYYHHHLHHSKRSE